MKQLKELQNIFQNYVLRPDESESIAWISAEGRALPETQISIYAYAYVSRLKEVLANDYPAVLVAVGKEQFDQLAIDYIEAHPSHYFSLRYFGCHFSGFIANTMKEHQCYSDKQWLYELALFEWTLGQAFDALDGSLISEKDMAAIPADAWPMLTFVFHPCVQRLDLEWNVAKIWQVLTAEKPTEIVAIREQVSPWLVWREQLVTRFRSMELGEQQALDKLRKGACFDDVCHLLATMMDENEVPMHAAGLLKTWIAQGLISEIQ